MKRKRFSVEQIVGALKQPVAEVVSALRRERDKNYDAHGVCGHWHRGRCAFLFCAIQKRYPKSQ